MTGELSLSGNKIIVLRDPISPEDAANKQYVDAGDATVDNKLTTLRTEYDAHVNQFVRLRRNYQKPMKSWRNSLAAHSPKLTDISKSLSDINTRLGVIRDHRSFSDLIAGLQTKIAGIVKILDDISNGIPDIVARTSLINISTGVAAADIVNISYVVPAGSATWSQQNNTIIYNSAVTSIYR